MNEPEDDFIKPLPPIFFEKFVVKIRPIINSIDARKSVPPENAGEPELQFAKERLQDVLIEQVLLVGLRCPDLETLNKVVPVQNRRELYDGILAATLAARNNSLPALQREDYREDHE